MSTQGAQHPPHVDSNGLATVVKIQEGYKLWVFARPRSGQPQSMHIPEDRDEGWQWGLMEDADVFATILGPGDGM